MKKLILFAVTAVFITACNNSSDKTSGNLTETDTSHAKPAAVPDSVSSGIKKPAAQPAAETRGVSLNNDDESAVILTHIDEYLVPKANVPEGKGVKNATVTLQNTLTHITFQRAFVEVKIFDSEDMEIRTDYLTFQNIEPGDIKTRKIPDTPRGSTVQVKVVKLKCDSLTHGQSILVGEKYVHPR